MNKSPSLIAILVKYKETENWTIYHVLESHREKDMKLYLYHLRELAKKTNSPEKFKLEYYEPSN